MTGVEVTAVDGGVICHDLKSMLSGEGRDFLVRNNGDQVKISDLEGKGIGLYFSASWCGPCHRFTPKLVEAYNELSSEDFGFEVVYVSGDEDEESFNNYFSGMPWLAIPFSDSATRDRLNKLFNVTGRIPRLTVLDKHGKVVNDEGVEIVEDHGVEACPFSAERLDELAEKKRARMEAQTLESLLVSGESDYVIGKDGIKVAVSELVGKNILLYFSADWCPPCRPFLPELTETYNKIKAKDPAFELIFISSDDDQASFDDYFARMPWLAIPFGDERIDSLSRTFKINGVPYLMAIGPTGRTVTKDARNMITMHGAEAYPFTEEHIKELEAAKEEVVKHWPEKLKHALHEEHELIRVQGREYECDGCDEPGSGWSFYCKECDFDLHPKCALHQEEEKDDGVMVEKPGYACDGEVCHKV